MTGAAPGDWTLRGLMDAIERWEPDKDRPKEDALALLLLTTLAAASFASGGEVGRYRERTRDVSHVDGFLVNRYRRMEVMGVPFEAMGFTEAEKAQIRDWYEMEGDA